MPTPGIAYRGLAHLDGTSPEGVPEDQYITTFFCRALYDYQSNDASFLSFRRNDIIEVHTQSESGWWDGLLGNQRGWFPSNYVTTVSDEEAELAIWHHEQQALERSRSQRASQGSVERTGHPWREGAHNHCTSEVWWDAAAFVDSSDGFPELTGVISEGEEVTSNDFWTPQATHDDQARSTVNYVHARAGRHSRDLHLHIDDTSDGGFAGLPAPQPSSAHAGTSTGSGLGFSAETHMAGFGVPKRSVTPEPWVRRLADDGMSYFYVNKLTSQVSWTLPETEFSSEKGCSRALTTSSTSSLRKLFSLDEACLTSPSWSDSTAGQDCGPCKRYPNPPGLVSDSDDSTIYFSVADITSFPSTSPQDDLQDEPTPAIQRNPDPELAMPKRIARFLQQSLAPPPPELVSDLTRIAQDAITSVVKKNQSLAGTSRRSDHAQALDSLVRSVVVSVRDLLYVSAPPSRRIPSQPGPRGVRDRHGNTAAEALKRAQRNVTATLSKLVLSSRAMEYDLGLATHEAASRIESNADELERAIVDFVVEVQRSHSEQQPATVGTRRAQGCFSVAHVGTGLVGAGYGGTWKGFGWVPMDDPNEFPQTPLSSDAFSELKTHILSAQSKFGSMHSALRDRIDQSEERVWMASRGALTALLTLLPFVSNLHIARHVDIDGVYAEFVAEEDSATYTQTVHRARLLSRTLEAALQALHDDASIMLLTTQRIRQPSSKVASRDRDDLYDYLDAIAASIQSNLQFLLQILDALLSVGYDQAHIAERDDKSAIEWRLSRLSMVDDHYDVRPMSVFNPADPESEDIIDFEVAFGFSRSERGPVRPDRVSTSRSRSQMPDNTSKHDSVRSASSSNYTALRRPSGQQRDAAPVSPTTSCNEGESSATWIGDDAHEHIGNTGPWYLQPDYTGNDLVLDVDGSVRAGTVPALVERLTSHETGDPTFIRTFLMTYKSFTTLDDLFDLLVQRFYIQPPHDLTRAELEEWMKLKQHIIRMRVLNTLKAMVVDDDFLEKEDMYILDRMREFLLQEAVSKIAISKQLVMLIDRARAGELKKTIRPNLVFPPISIVPKTTRRLKLCDLDPLELARQLTILESRLYQKIRPIECLARSREQKTDRHDNIARVIQTSNKIANWVADSVLMHEDPRKRAALLKQFIFVADHCRSLHNFSSMAAIVSGLRSTPIRRLKRSWEQVGSRQMAQLSACETTIDPRKNFANYRSTLAEVAPPCVPFIGVFLTDLLFIQGCTKDTLQGTLINFWKRQQASKVIQDIQRWQILPHHFHPLSAVQRLIEGALDKFNDQVDVSEKFWNLSIQLEPRERDDGALSSPTSPTAP